MGIKVDVRRGKKWSFVVVDFGDGEQPIVKGPMTDVEADEMVVNLKADMQRSGGVVKDRSVEEAKINRIVAYATATGIACTILALILFAGWR
jgi:hypothetical protein